MQVCNDCNHPLDADDHFCAHCGTPVDRADRTVAVATGGLGVSPDRAGSALGSLEATLRKDATDAGRLTQAAFERLCEGEVDDALLAAESAVTMNPRLWSAHLLAGVARNQRGETEQAEAHLHDALQADPMVVHHKAALERMLAATLPKKRVTFAAPKWFSTMSPATWATMIGVPVLLLGLVMILMMRPRNEFTRERPKYTSVDPSSPVQPNAPINQPFPTPAPPQNTYTPPPYSPPPPSAYFNTPPANQTGAAPPTREGANVPYQSIQPQRSGPGALPSADRETPLMEPLPPASPNVNGVPELELRRRGGENPENAQRAAADREQAQNATPWNNSAPQNQNRAGAGFNLMGPRTGRATVGNVPSSGARPNLPPPSDAVTSAARVAPSPQLPQRPASPAPAPNREAPRSPSGRDLQANARRLQNQGRNTEAARAYREAINAYQEEIAEGRNPRSAEYGIAASKAALDLLESGR